VFAYIRGAQIYTRPWYVEHAQRRSKMWLTVNPFLSRALQLVRSTVSFSDSEDDEFNPRADVNIVQKTKGKRKVKDSKGSPRQVGRASRGGGRRPANAPHVKFGRTVPQSLQEFFGKQLSLEFIGSV